MAFKASTFNLLIFISIFHTIAAKEPTSYIKLINFEKCKADGPAPIKWSIKVGNADDAGHKIIDFFEADLTAGQFTDKLEYTFDVDKQNGGDWEQDVFNDSGNFCNMIKLYIPKAWQKMMSEIQPTPMNICNAQPAVYTLEKFEVSRKDLQIPPLYGKLKTKLRLFNEHNENLLCFNSEVEVTDE